ncbi:uncharacterized protein SPSC_02083 [Sporisorium scitamineum]|uniref:Uncharacterized protein n=1 Tax=Sporisorium scitamineum TaxID=49012 RepID=A0A0F7RZN6_9BASI|nr:hypothetical protein [Sporisorium scitamineum]CDU23454.1 uncharacterized protein SPSC_02083 [Sporisorium scitamineum]
MSSDCSVPPSQASSSSSSTIVEAHPASTTLPNDNADAQFNSSAPSSLPHRASLDKQSCLGATYDVKGKRRASHDDLSDSSCDDAHRLTGALTRLSVRDAPPSAQASRREVSPHHAQQHLGVNASEPSSPGKNHSYRASSRSNSPPSSARSPNKFAAASTSRDLLSSPQRRDREQRTRKGRGGASRSVAPSPLRSSLTPSPTTCSASQFVSLLGQPVAVSASLSPPDISSAAATSAVLPSLYKASRGRSMNVSPSRRWDRRGASASVLSGASASGSGGEGDDPSDEDNSSRRATLRSNGIDRRAAPTSRSSSRRLSVAKEEALFPSDDDDSPPLSPSQQTSGLANKLGKHPRRSRRWSSIERERSRGMRILLQERSSELEHSATAPRVSRPKSSSRGRTRSAHRFTSAAEEDASDAESSFTPSSCSSSCDLDYVPTRGDSAAIPIKAHRSRSTAPTEGAPITSASTASSQDQVPSSTDGSDEPSPAASTPSTSLVQKSPPGFTAPKPIVSIPVASESDPLLGLATPSVEDLIQIDKVEFFPEETITAQLASAQVKHKTSPKRSKKSSWIIGDFESEPESEEEQEPIKATLNGTVNRDHAAAVNTSPPTPSPSSYQARLASLQSQLRIWSRTPDAPSPTRARQITSSSEDQTDAEADGKDVDSNSPGLLSASWRNLTRLPNLILLPGLAARQARESLASASKAQSNASDCSDGDRASPSASDNDFAQIYRLASSNQGFSDENVLQAQRNVALKTGRPPSPSPSPSPPASLLGSRQSSNDSLAATERAYPSQSVPGAPRRGRGVASPLEADRDPSAYVSGLGQPIDPDTELSSVVQLQTFRSRSRSRPAEVRHRSRASEDSRSDTSRHSARRESFDEPRGSRSPKKLEQPLLSPKELDRPVEPEPAKEETTQAVASKFGRSSLQLSPKLDGAGEPLSVQIPALNTAAANSKSRLDCQGLLAQGPAPTDTASAPTSPTYRKETSSSTSSADETDSSISSPPYPGQSREEAPVDADGFRVVRRRHRRRSSGPRSLRPKVEALVPQGYSAFAIEEGDEDVEGSGSDGETTPSPTQARGGRGRRGRDSSPRRSTRQCAVGLFGGGVSAVPSSSESPSTSRPRRSARRESANIGISAPIRSVRSSPDLTYAAAAASRTGREGDEDGQGQTKENPSPPRGSRGRRGAVKIVASSVGQQPSVPQPLLLGGLEGYRRGPSYPPRAGEILEDGLGGSDGSEYDSSAAGSAPSAAPGGRGRSASSPICGNAASQPLRFRLLSNSSHLLMLSLELDMIKKQKISAPLKPRWGKHRANDFNPLPSTISYLSSAAVYASSRSLRSPYSASRDDHDADADAGECQDDQCPPCDQREADMAPSSTSSMNGPRKVAAPTPAVDRLGNPMPATVGCGGLRNPSSSLRYSWSLADIASALDAAAAPAGI